MAKRKVPRTQDSADAGERDFQLVRDRNEFLGALDRQAPDILKSLDYRPIEKHDLEATDHYVRKWAERWPPLAAMPWFVDAARTQAFMKERKAWLPLGAFGDLGKSMFFPPPSAGRAFDWNPFAESEHQYVERECARTQAHIAKVKQWMTEQGHPPEPPAQREREDGIPIHKRWDLVVRYAVLGHTYEELRSWFDNDDEDLDGYDLPVDKVLRMTIRRCAAQIGLPIPKKT